MDVLNLAIGLLALSFSTCYMMLTGLVGTGRGAHCH